MSQVTKHGEFKGNLPQIRSTALVAVGSNLPTDAGDPVQTIEAAIETLKEFDLSIRAISQFYETPAFPAGAGPDYVNAAFEIAAGKKKPHEIMTILHQVEASFGRARVQRWGQRTLDLDLIAIGQTVLPDGETHAAWRNLPLKKQMELSPEMLILPHPRLQDRAFVLVPLRDIAPDWVHPILQKSVLQMCSELPDDLQAEVKPLVNSAEGP